MSDLPTKFPAWLVVVSVMPPKLNKVILSKYLLFLHVIKEVY